MNPVQSTSIIDREPEAARIIAQLGHHVFCLSRVLATKLGPGLEIIGISVFLAPVGLAECSDDIVPAHAELGRTYTGFWRDDQRRAILRDRFPPRVP